MLDSHMKQYASFIFDSCNFSPETGKIFLNYSLDGEIRFTETLTLPHPPPTFDPSSPSFHAALRALHLCGGVSYYKTCLPKQIEVRTEGLTREQADFWNAVYENGLGEFFYRNDIDFRGLLQFPSVDSPPPTIESTIVKPKSGRVLIPLGGGKDSIVTAELLRKSGHDVTLLRMGAHPMIDAEVKALGLPVLTVERHLSPILFRLNAEGALNGHVPVSAYLSFLAVVIAEVYGFDTVVMSNERSANEGNVEYLGKKINHQWSKSLEAERMMQEYIRVGIDPLLQYFSLLRPLSEVAIAKIFAEFPQYFGCVTSCNANWKILSKPQSDARPRWCGHCPKCAFVFACLAAFLPKNAILEMFGADLFSSSDLLPLFRELLGVENFKPFECVGTADETKAAFLLIHDRGEFTDTPAMKMFLSDILPAIKNPKKLIEDARKPSNDHCIPVQFQKLLTDH